MVLNPEVTHHFLLLHGLVSEARTEAAWLRARAALAKVEHFQVAASGITPFVNGVALDHAETLTKVFIIMGPTAFAAGETCTVDVRLNGGSLLTAPVALNNATAVSTAIDISGSLAAPRTALLVGAQLTDALVYVPGGAPAHPSFAVVIR